MTTTKERPILFSGPMVQAILAGRKTQTRRVVKGPGVIDDHPETGLPWPLCPGYGKPGDNEGDPMPCPYGKPGDRLWVRETWKCENESNDYVRDLQRLHVGYAAGPVAGFGQQQVEFSGANNHERSHQAWGSGKSGNWRPSIHMPRWASRILLEVVSVRVERLQDIRDADCWAEGLESVDGMFDNDAIIAMANRQGRSFEDPQPSFGCLWDSINAKRGHGWDNNPWVWVVEFRLVARAWSSPKPITDRGRLLEAADMAAFRAVQP